MKKKTLSPSATQDSVAAKAIAGKAGKTKKASPDSTSAGSRRDAQQPDRARARAAAQAAEVDAAVAAVPYNANKGAEHAVTDAPAPPVGTTVDLSELASGSTLSEPNASIKTGAPPLPGASPGSNPLDRVRTDGSGQRLTTNQGVAVADNQNSLTAGPRGPALLKDFILREKITHFDHERIPGMWSCRFDRHSDRCCHAPKSCPEPETFS